MPMQSFQEFPRGSICRNAVRDRLDAFEPKTPILIASQDGPSFGSFSIVMLQVIEPGRISLPGIDLGTLDRIPLGVFESAQHQEWFALRVMRYCLPIWYVFSIGTVKWT